FHCYSASLSSSPVHIRQDKIQAPQNDNQVRNHQAPGQERHRLYVREGRGPYACAVRNRAPVAHQVVTVVTLGGFNGAQRFTHRHYWSPAHAQEMRDQGFDVVHGAVLHRRSRERVIRFIRTVRHILYALLDDAKALPHLLDMHRRAVIAIAVLACWNIELKLFVSRVGLALAKIPFKSTSAKGGPGHAPHDSLTPWEAGDTFGARFEKPVSHHGAVVFEQAGRQVRDEIADHLVPAFGQIGGDTADPKPGGMHARARNRFDDAESPLAVVKRAEDRGHLSEVLRKGAVPDEMADNAEQLREHHANHLGTGRYLDARQRLHRHQVGQVVHHTAEVVHTIGVGYVGVPGLALAHFFRAAMMKADLRNRIDDLFAIELHHNAQGAVGAGMLGTDVEENEIRTVAFTAHAPFLWTEAERLLLGHFFLVWQLIWPHLRRACRMLFAERVARPSLGHQNPFKVRVTVKSDPEHVPHFALVPVGGGPDIGNARQRKLVLRKGYLDAQIFVSIEGQKMIDNGEITRRRPIALRFHPFIDGGGVVHTFLRPFL